jgi:transposase
VNWNELPAVQPPALRAEIGCGPIVVRALLVGQTAGARRFPTDAPFARQAGVARIPANSGNTRRYRLHRGGNRQINKALHIIALNRDRLDPQTQTYLQRQRDSDELAEKLSGASYAPVPDTFGACSTTQALPRPLRPNAPPQRSGATVMPYT